MGFVCVTCHKNDYATPECPTSFGQSYGPCEDCKKTGPCWAHCKCWRNRRPGSTLPSVEAVVAAVEGSPDADTPY